MVSTLGSPNACCPRLQLLTLLIFSLISHRFRGQFVHKSIEESIQDLSEFLQQRLGGRGFYSERKGLPNLLRHHCGLKITETAADKWCELMTEALEENEADISDSIADVLKDFFRFTAFFLVVAGEKMAGMKCKRTYDPFPDPILSLIHI